MSRNDTARFSQTRASANIGRSTFNMNHDIKFTGNAGDLIPFDAIEVLPGDTFQMNPATLVRMLTPLHATMDNAYVDFYAFFVPYRLVWSNWEKFNGEAEPSEWIEPVERLLPQCSPTGDSLSMLASDYFGSVYDYLGFPYYGRSSAATSNINVANGHCLHHRAYRLIWNEWFRDQNLQDSLNINFGDSEPIGNAAFVDLGRVMKSCKFADYFTSALPQPQKGDQVALALSTEDLPVYAGAQHDEVNPAQSLHFMTNYSFQSTETHPFYRLGIRPDGVASNYGTIRVSRVDEPQTNAPYNITPDNLWARSSAALAVSVNELRLAFQLQRILELSARSGSRYTEIIRAFFGVVSPDQRLQRPEYLGGKRVPLNISQVLQQSSTVNGASGSTTYPLGTVGGYSKTVDTFRGFNKSFTEAGVILWLATVRYDHSYQQGLNRMYSRRTKYDFYWPQFAHLGEQGIRNKEIYFGSDSESNEQIFGYQEAWAEYRYLPNRVAGAFRSGALGGSLDSWHYADDYAARPNLSSSWIQETPVNVDRTLAVSSVVSHQFMFDIYMQTRATRPMPVYSIPGLIDHY